MEELIKRINELARLAKNRELTESEKQEQAQLRSKYLAIFRQNFLQQLKNVTVVDETGTDITPEPLKRKKQMIQ